MITETSLFEIGVFIYLIFGLAAGLWGVFFLKKKLNGRFPPTRDDFAQLKKEASSSWDPFGDKGSKRWRALFYGMFAALMVILFMGW